jgi:hypothetical protein
MKRFNTDEEIEGLVHSFEDATISRDAWKHPEHLTVALYYIIHNGLDAATDKMRTGIYKLLSDGFGVDLSKEMPYHETMTIFWMRTVDEYVRSTNGSSLLEKANDLVEAYDKNYPLKFYSRELLFSEEARKTFVAADLNDGGDQ